MPAPKAVFPAIVGPLESQVEHGGTRAQYAHVVADSYARDYEQIFGALPVSLWCRDSQVRLRIAKLL